MVATDVKLVLACLLVAANGYGVSSRLRKNLYKIGRTIFRKANTMAMVIVSNSRLPI